MLTHPTGRRSAAHRAITPALSVLGLSILSCGGSTTSEGRTAEQAAGSAGGSATAGTAGAAATDMGGGASGKAEFVLAGGDSGIGHSGGTSATGGQLGGGATAGSTADECDCRNETVCPTLDYLLNEACGALEPGQGLVQIWQESCELTTLQFGSIESLAVYVYDPSGALVGRLSGDALEGMRANCGIHCSTPDIRACALCGTTSYPACEP